MRLTHSYTTLGRIVRLVHIYILSVRLSHIYILSVRLTHIYTPSVRHTHIKFYIPSAVADLGGCKCTPFGG